MNWSETVFKGCNRFISVHALGFSFYNILHCTNWVINGMGERFPKLPVIWVEAGLAWVPFLMQRLDHEYMLRHLGSAAAQEEAVRLHARHVLLDAADGSAGHGRAGMHVPHDQRRNASCCSRPDYPHWDFDLPTVIWDSAVPVGRRRKHHSPAADRRAAGSSCRRADKAVSSAVSSRNSETFGGLAGRATPDFVPAR